MTPITDNAGYGIDYLVNNATTLTFDLFSKWQNILFLKSYLFMNDKFANI